MRGIKILANVNARYFFSFSYNGFQFALRDRNLMKYYRIGNVEIQNARMRIRWLDFGFVFDQILQKSHATAIGACLIRLKKDNEIG